MEDAEIRDKLILSVTPYIVEGAMKGPHADMTNDIAHSVCKLVHAIMNERDKNDRP